MFLRRCFLTAPEDYDGGELIVEDTYGTHRVKLPAGHMVLYPATSLHRVEPVTRGARVSSFFWIQSMIRSDGDRTMLFDLDTAIQRLAMDLPGMLGGAVDRGVSQPAAALGGDVTFAFAKAGVPCSRLRFELLRLPTTGCKELPLVDAPDLVHHELERK